MPLPSFARKIAMALCGLLIMAAPLAGPASANPNYDYLKQNKTKPGVQVTKSGLQYRVLREGKGKSPSKSDEVEVHYKGTLINGKVFDSSYKRGKTSSFGVDQVIAGWTEGLQLMKEGAKYEFVIPANLAYGTMGNDVIPANSTLIFEVELVKVR
jgi:FKBP-type peptidyl-prolyl cis-trans isomerase